MKVAVLLCLAGFARAELPEVEITKIFDDSSGGSFTLASQVQIEGKRVFLKSNRGSQRGTRYANFESDILARRIFERVGIRCPDARMVRIGSAPKTQFGRDLDRWMGTSVLAMEFVNTRFASGRVYYGVWPDGDKADIARFIDLLLIDIMIGNADRRGANLFATASYDETEKREGPGSVRPIPIDNNSGFGTMVVWRMPSSQTNFLETYDGVGTTNVMRDLGTIANIILDSEVHQALLAKKELHKRILKRAAALATLFDDAFVDAMVRDLPREIIPRGVSVETAGEKWQESFSDAEKKLLYGDITSPLKGSALFEFRKVEIARRFKWRRDHLVEALSAHIAAPRTVDTTP